jgi:uncharacterized protein involved in high-affinity Fe2+ transport
MTDTTPAHTPPAAPSDEADPKGLEIARQEGDVYGRAVRHMTEEVADHGAETRAGEYLVGYAVEKAEGMYRLRDGALEWMAPQGENLHVEVVVRDGADGRFLPGLTVHAELLDSGGRSVGRHEQPFLWHPTLFHYGRNWTVPGDGEYTLRVDIAVPEWMRHDKDNGRRFTQPVRVEFTRVPVKTGNE